MTRLRSALAGAAFAVLGLCAFSFAAVGKEAFMNVLGQDDSGRTVEMVPGSRIIIRLPENLSTGYSWQLDAFKDGALILEDITLQSSSSVPGAANIRVFVFRAQSPGTALLRLQLRRSWEAKAAAKTFEVTVQVMQDKKS